MPNSTRIPSLRRPSARPSSGLALTLLAVASASAWACGSSGSSSNSAGDGGTDGSMADVTTESDTGTPTDGSSNQDTSTAPEASTTPEASTLPEASTQPDGSTIPDASGDSSTTPDATSGDAATDASDAGPNDLVLASGVDNSNGTWGAVYAMGAWAATSIGSDVYDPVGGGVVVTPGRHGLAAYRGNANDTIEAAEYAGSWPMLASEGTMPNTVSAPAAAPSGAFVAYGGQSLGLATYVEAMGMWSPASQATGAAGENNAVPAVVTTSTGDPMILVLSSTGGTYSYVLRTGGTWGTLSTITGSAGPGIAGGSAPAITAVRVAGSSTIVAAMAGANMGEIDTAVYSGGTWTTTKNVATNAPFSQGAPFSLAALPDGRVALAYLDATQAMHLAFYSGSTWGTFSSVPGTCDHFPRFPISIARGANGTAVLELAYLDGTGDSRTPQHIRLTGESPQTWSSPVKIATGGFDSVRIAVGP